MGDYKAQRKASAIDGQNIKWNWGDDWPDALDVISRGVQGRPLSKIFSILDLLDELNHGSYCRRPRPGKPGGKPLAATQDEKEMEVDRRKEAQKACQRLIVPRQPKEDADVFLRRLDAHRNAPEQLFAPQMPGEEPMQACKRLIAGKKNETAGVLMFPKSSHETNKEYEERLAVAESSRASVLPKGAAENAQTFGDRLRAQPKCGVPIMPRSHDEKDDLFKLRLDVAKMCTDVVHPYDEARENYDQCTNRLHAQKDSTGLALEPGHPRFNEREGPVVHKEKKVVEEMTPALLALKLAEKEEAERLKKQHAEDAKRKAEEDAEKALIEAESGERAAQREADKLRRELEAKAAAERAANPTFEQESVSLSALGFMTLKKKLVERGVPQADVNKAENKFALKEIASKYDCKITFVD